MGVLNTGLLVSAFIRRASVEGGMAMLIKRGDEMAGALLVIGMEKGVVTGVYEQIMTSSGGYEWAKVGPQTIENTQEIDDYLARRKDRDPDLWILELDIPDPARFIAGTGSMG